MSEGSDADTGEKIHDPTPQKLDEARRKGDLPRSTDVSATAAYFGLGAAILTTGAIGIRLSAEPLLAFIHSPDRLTAQVLGPGGLAVAGSIFAQSLAPLAGLLMLPFLTAFLSLLAQRAFVLAPQKLAPKLNRISPVAGAKNKFGVNGLFEFAKTAIKMSVVAVTVAIVLTGERERLVSAFYLAPGEIAGEMGRLILLLLGAVTAISVAIALPDYLWQWTSHRRKLRMSHEEIREEVKQSEGDPHFKSERRQRGQEIATNRMLLDVPKADVIIVNPTHFAVALKWDRRKGTAPVCVAKGMDGVAARIREAASAARIPIHSDPPTARLIHDTVAVGSEIRPDQYRAVAAALRFADQMRRKARERSR